MIGYTSVFFTVFSMEEEEVVVTAGKWIEERATDGFGLTIKINIVTRVCFIRFLRVSYSQNDWFENRSIRILLFHR